MLTRNKARAEELSSVRITRSKASVAHVRVGVIESELPKRVQRKRGARSLRGIANNAKNTDRSQNDVPLREEAGNGGAGQRGKAETSQESDGPETQQVMAKANEAAPPNKGDAVQSLVLPEKLSTFSVTAASAAVVNPIALAATLPRGPTLEKPMRSRNIIDVNNAPFDYYVFLDLETNDALLPLEKTRILDIAVCVTNENFEPLDDGFSTLVHWPNMTVEQLRLEMPLKVREMHKQLMFEYERTPVHQRRTLGQVEVLVCKYLERHGFRAGLRQAIMSGAGISFDRALVREHMRQLNSYFHFQTCDMTSLWHIVKRKYKRWERYQGSSAHRAMADIQGSMREAKMYLDLIFKSPDQVQWPF